MKEIPARQRIYSVLACIPSGRVATYGQIARLAGLGRGARQVGQTLKTLPAGSTLPWHRVINAAGRISLPASSDSFAKQQKRLRDEGVIVRGDKISLAQFQWRP